MPTKSEGAARDELVAATLAAGLLQAQAIAVARAARGSAPGPHTTQSAVRTYRDILRELQAPPPSA